MDVRSLRAFAAVVRQGGFTRAGAALHLTQPAVSKLVKGLEEELGVPLLLRAGRRVELTDAGRAVAERAQAVLDALRSVEEAVGDVAAVRRGRLRVGLPPMVGASLFPGVIAGYRRAHPGVELAVREEGARRVEELVLAGDLDLGVTLLPTSAALEVLPLHRDVLRAVLHPRHPLARRRRLALRDLAATPLVLYRPDFVLHGRILEACRAAGFTPQVAAESAQWDFIAGLAAAGVGAALLPGTLCRALPASRLAAVPLADPVIAWDLALAWRRGAWLPAAARAWVELTSRSLARPLPPPLVRLGGRG
ncbi:LysR substrate-binding domain-containing protein [Anaeromyxobacter diazotrophicus]|uniref:LysR family transcriptional regulator n=1 Tax=Anaeromyxobacter diazotrophicus TaxID=2590199 RepID=A0A7I9VJ75_9BACT|nr:LysR substrate-binding domain-containing protein [Anaeromyxobacter diazotrophicus]GEJ56461.1 LysR family transcriptional regulator [Anaeromyxobacter diazotrophicus]